MSKRHEKVLRETANSRVYNVTQQHLMSIECGEFYAKDWSIAICGCPNHRKWWTFDKMRRIEHTYSNRKSWKHYRKTQYKVVSCE